MKPLCCTSRTLESPFVSLNSGAGAGSILGPGGRTLKGPGCGHPGGTVTACAGPLRGPRWPLTQGSQPWSPVTASLSPKLQRGLHTALPCVAPGKIISYILNWGRVIVLGSNRKSRPFLLRGRQVLMGLLEMVSFQEAEETGQRASF